MFSSSYSILASRDDSFAQTFSFHNISPPSFLLYHTIIKVSMFLLFKSHIFKTIKFKKRCNGEMGVFLTLKTRKALENQGLLC